MTCVVTVWRRMARPSGRAVGVALMALALGVGGRWLGAQPASAQELPPQSRQIIRPDLAYPTEYPTEGGERRAEEAAPDERAAPARAGRPVVSLREWTQPAFDGSRIPLAGIQAGAGRYAPAGPAAPLAGNLFVNSTADVNSADAVLTLREALLVANGAMTGAFTSAEQAQMLGCTFNVSGFIVGGCGANIQDTIWFSTTLGFRPVITLAAPLPPISDTRPTLLLGAFSPFNNVQPVINAQNLSSAAPGLVVNSNGNEIVAVSVISAPGIGIRLNGNQNLVGTWTMARNNGSHGIYIAGLTNTVSNSYVGVFSNTVTNQLDCAGNAQEGIYMVSSARATTIQKSVIACNGQGGILVGNSPDNLIGGPSYLLNGNAIYSNTFEGVYLSGSNARRNVVQANDILGNGSIGVRVSAGQQNTITIGASPFDFNLISTNYFDGVRLEGGAQNNLLAGAQVVNNYNHGVNLIDSDTLGNIITRTGIFNNVRDGIRQDPHAGPNIWREMSISANGGLGIDTDAADDFSNTPNPPFFFITSVNQNTGLVQGRASGTAFLAITFVDLYRIALDPTGFGEGYEFVGSAATDVNGNWSITDPSPSLSRGCYTAVVRGVAFVLPYATEFTRTNCAVFAPITRKP